MNQVQKWIVIIIGALLALSIIVSMGFYFGYSLPKANREKIQLQKDQLEIDRTKVQQAQKAAEDANAKVVFNLKMQQTCMDGAFKNYSDEWDGSCLMLGRTANCSLPNIQAESVNKNYKDARDLCVRRYPN